MFSSFFLGLNYLKSGFALIRVDGIRRYVVIPLCINILVFVGLGWALSDLFSQALSWFEFDPDSWIGAIVDKLLFVLWVVFGLALLVIFSYTFTLVANLIAAPFNSLLSEKIEAHLNGSLGHKSSDSFKHVLKSMPKILHSEISKLLYLLLWTIPVLLLFVIPGINILAPFVSFLFGAWMFSLEYMDYPMSNNGHLFGSVKKSLRKKRHLALGFGSAVTLISIIPILNLIAMPVAVAGATKLWVDQQAKNSGQTSL
jgi:CysZ protein